MLMVKSRNGQYHRREIMRGRKTRGITETIMYIPEAATVCVGGNNKG